MSPKKIEYTPRDATIFEIQLESLSTGIELNFMGLDTFPIKYSNFPKNITEIVSQSLGHTHIKIGNRILSDMQITLSTYEKYKNRFQLLKIENHHFELSIGVILKNCEIIADPNSYYEYKINGMNNNKLIGTINLFRDIFNGDAITFTTNIFKGNLSIYSSIEVEKFNIILDITKVYEKLSKKLKLNPNIAKSNLSFYTIYLMWQLENNKSEVKTWLNLYRPSGDIKKDDEVIFYNIHTLDNLPYNLREEIRFVVGENEITRNKLNCIKKEVVVKFKKVKK